MDDYPQLRLYIDGRWLEGTGSGSVAVENPADGSELGRLPVAGDAELDAALAAAARGFRVWRSLSAFERFQIMVRATRLMRERAPRIARAITLEQGKPLAEALREVQLSADIIDFLAEEGKRLYGRTVPPRQANVLSQTVMRQPVGPVAAFTPWNFPVNLPSRKLGGALAAGCSVIIKPAEETTAKFRNAGQVCASPIRFQIHESRYAEFRDRFVEHARALKVGSGLDQGSDMGPLIHGRRLREMQNFVDDALASGGKLCCGGQALPGTGHFYPPTVLEQVPAAARVRQVEPFGPIALLQPFSTLDEALAEANGLAVGLSAYAFTRDLATAHRLGQELEAGMVGINHFGVSQPETPCSWSPPATPRPTRCATCARNCCAWAAPD